MLCVFVLSLCAVPVTKSSLTIGSSTCYSRRRHQALLLHQTPHTRPSITIMITTRIASVFVAAAMVTMASAQKSWASTPVTLIPTPTVTLPAREMTEVGCFATGIPLQNYGPHEFQSTGNCQLICVMLDKPVMALTDGENCWCGDLKPPESAKEDDSQCDTPCIGDDTVLCMCPSTGFEAPLTGHRRWTFHVVGFTHWYHTK